jgi:hypothetical protein
MFTSGASSINPLIGVFLYGFGGISKPITATYVLIF